MGVQKEAEREALRCDFSKSSGLLWRDNSFAVARFLRNCIPTFQRRNDTKSIRGLVDELSLLDVALAARIRTSVDAQKPLLGKVFSIRGNVYAHRNKTQTPYAAFAAARLTPKEMRAVVHLAQNTVATLAEAAGLGIKGDVKRDIRRRQAFAILDTRQIMRALAKF